MLLYIIVFAVLFKQIKTKDSKEKIQRFINVDEVIDKVLVGFLKREKRKALDLCGTSNKSKSININLDLTRIKHDSHATSAVAMVLVNENNNKKCSMASYDH